MAKDDLGNRMKMYEKAESGRRFIPLLPVCARLDGRSFSKFTKDLAKPYDIDFAELMQDVTQYMVEETNACIGYTHSDEISLVWYSNDTKSQIFFDGKIQKMVSILAAMCSTYFMYELPVYLPDKWELLESPVMFDCRVWQMPNLIEATNVFLWREFDATRNSVQSSARSVYSHKECLDKNTSQLQEMLFDKGINWNDYPDFFKRGSYFQRRLKKTKFSAEEIKRLPEKHAARLNPELEIERHVVERIDMPIFAKITNKVAVIFNGSDPAVENDY